MTFIARAHREQLQPCIGVQATVDRRLRSLRGLHRRHDPTMPNRRVPRRSVLGRPFDRRTQCETRLSSSELIRRTGSMKQHVSHIAFWRAIPAKCRTSAVYFMWRNMARSSEQPALQKHKMRARGKPCPCQHGVGINHELTTYCERCCFLFAPPAPPASQNRQSARVVLHWAIPDRERPVR